MSSNNSPPPPNPILNAYEQFTRDTPFVTRTILTTLCVTWLFGFFLDLTYATATIPYFCLYSFEIYRIIISPFICLNILSLVFAFISFMDNGKRLEFSMGSTAFGWYILTVAVCTNVAFLVILFLANGLTGEPGFLWRRSVGIWTILFGLIATECSRAPRDSQRRLFFFTVPTIYFPLALWALFSLLGGLDLADLISVSVGYAYGHGYLDKLKLSPSRFHQWEETVLANFTQRPGWVVGHAAAGDDAWNNTGATGSGFNLFPAPSSTESSQQGTSAPGQVAAPADPAFPPSGGRALGSGPVVRRSSSDRAAVLAAAEKRAENRAAQQEEGDDQV